jgi:hypothetical protein
VADPRRLFGRRRPQRPASVPRPAHRAAVVEAARRFDHGGMSFRVARHSDRLDEVLAFYRDRLGLPERGRFADHGYARRLNATRLWGSL